MYNNCVRRMMLYSSEHCALRQEDEKRLDLSERAMLLWLCNIKKERVSTYSVLSWLKLESLDIVFWCNRLPWFGYVKWRELYTGQILDLEVEGNTSRGHQRWWQWNLQAETCQNRSEWRKRLKTGNHTHAELITWHYWIGSVSECWEENKDHLLPSPAVMWIVSAHEIKPSLRKNCKKLRFCRKWQFY